VVARLERKHAKAKVLSSTGSPVRTGKPNAEEFFMPRCGATFDENYSCSYSFSSSYSAFCRGQVRARRRGRFLRSPRRCTRYHNLCSVLVLRVCSRTRTRTSSSLKLPSYHINRPTMIPCQRPVPMSENDPRVPLKVPKVEGSVALKVEFGGLKLWYLYTLLTSKRS
jgi:hypothetical protein